MLSIPGSLRIFIATSPVDCRKRYPSGRVHVDFSAIDGRSGDKDSERARDAQHDLLQSVSSTA